MRNNFLDLSKVKTHCSCFMQRHARFTGFAISIFTFLLLFSCSSGGEKADEALESDAATDITVSRQQFAEAGMELSGIKDTIFHTFIKGTGFVDVPAGNRVVSGSYYGGKVAQIMVITGERVNKGEVLYIIENPAFLDMQQAYLETAGQLRNLNAAYERQKALIGENVASQKDFLQSETDYLAAEARLNALGQKLKLMQIDPEKLTAENLSAQLKMRAPITASVSKIMVTPGQWLNPETEAMELINNDIIWVRLSIYEKDLPMVKTGQNVWLNLVENTSKVFEGMVESIGRTVDRQNRFSEVIVPIRHNHTSVLIPGMYVSGNIAVDNYEVRCLPEEAVVDIDGTHYGLLLINETADEYHFQKIELFTGQTMFGLTGLTRATKLPKDARFLSKGAFQLIQEQG
ncbi:MAG: efflux RND transporter periplasmic adaptor subunit [Lentimicrobiaceae bacterium]|nr:efflux RND transporter periplasmic adaptor subunit [Lentimicrobiaceae bacterium]